MRVLVTGNSGYIGSVLTPLLLERGHDIAGLDSNLFEACHFGTHPLLDIPTTVKDVRDIDQSDVSDFDAVIHLAGLSNDALGNYRPELTDSINHLASVRLAELAKAAGVKRFLFASSCSNYGAAGNDFLTEDAAFKPVTPYGRSKVDTEQDLSQLADDNFSPVYLRASTAYGVSPRLRFDLVVNNLTAWACATKRVYLKSDGTPWRPVAHIEDIARAYVEALHAPRANVHNQGFNIGTTTENYQIHELARIVRSIVPGCEIELAPDAGSDERCYRVDCNKIAKALPDFKPQWTAYRGVEELYDAFCTLGITHDAFEGARFSRISHIKHLVEQQRLTPSLRWAKDCPSQRTDLA